MLIEVQHWDMSDPSKGNIALCECGHGKARHQLLTGHCAACPSVHGLSLCRAFNQEPEPDICRCGHERSRHFDDEYDCQECGFTGCIEFVLQEDGC